MAVTAPRRPAGTEDRSLAELIASATESLQRLLRREIDLAKLEIQEQLDQAGKAVVSLAATLVLALLAAVVLSLAAAWGLAEVMPTGLAFLTVGVVYLVVAAVLGLSGRKRLTHLRPVPRQTVGTLKQDVQVAKQSISSGLSDETSEKSHAGPSPGGGYWPPATGNRS